MGDLRARLVELVAPTAIGGEIAAGVTLVDASTELGLALAFEVGGRAVRVEVAPVEEGRPCVARSARLSFAYRVDGDGASLGRIAAELCATVASRARANEDAVLARIAHDAETRVDDSGARVRLVRVDRLLERAGPIGERYLTLSPYVGCVIGCRFCYAQERVASARRFEGLPDVAWGSFVDVRVNAPDVLARELRDAPPWAIKFCPIVSDPYQAIDARHELTARCLEVLARERAPRTVLVLTRSKLVERDAARIAALPRGYAGVSIPTIDDGVRRRFEPRAASIDERLAALRRLRSAGARTFAVVQPILPGSIHALADTIADVASSARIDVLHGVHGATEFDAQTASDAWQREGAEALAHALADRGVRVWPGELPPD